MVSPRLFPPSLRAGATYALPSFLAAAGAPAAAGAAGPVFFSSACQRLFFSKSTS